MALVLFHYYLSHEPADERFYEFEFNLAERKEIDISDYIQALPYLKPIRSLYLAPDQIFGDYLSASLHLNDGDRILLGSRDQLQSEIESWNRVVLAEGLKSGDWIGMMYPQSERFAHLSLNQKHRKALVCTAYRQENRSGVYAKEVGRLSHGIRSRFELQCETENISLSNVWLNKMARWLRPKARPIFQAEFTEKFVPGISLFYSLQL